MSIKHWILSIGIACVAECLTAYAYAEKPNIIFILVDDMGYSDIGCYGGEIKTPALDRLAENGLRFTQMHNTAKCFPSRATLLTGLYAQDCGMSKRLDRFTQGVTLGEVLKTAGYRTLASGKHHSRESLYERGFDRYFGLLDGANNHFNPGLPREGEPKPAQKSPGRRHWAIDEQVLQPYTPPEKDFYSTDHYTQKAIDYLETYKDEEAPFFLYLAYTAPHDPLQAWPEDIAKYKGTYQVGYETVRNARIEKLKQLGIVAKDARISAPAHQDWDRLSENQQAVEARKMAVYAAMIDRVDQNIGKLISKLEALGKFENTLILFAADNGSSAEMAESRIHPEGQRAGDGLSIEKLGNIDYWASLGGDWANVSNTPFRENKASSYEGGTCTPFIAHWPDGIQNPGSINHAFVAHFIDVMPTLVELAGAEYPTAHQGQAVPPMAGKSFAAQLKGDLTSPRTRTLYWEFANGRAIRQGDWKAVAEKSNWELFDMSTDRNETTDLSKQYPERLAAMQQQWFNWYDSTPAPAL
ncbi:MULTISPECIES: arylsulfatase [unclassified Lentimonas]|uniref:arylsulfatase n=1 Tax=unclassified Lentimonas TaxID=2630993 RepID=UPI0013294F4E|nr:MULTISPECIES: arylsulfatase [unclassified Lentimonas]CAA6678561.1 Choline-sulfatase (EC [Lentimonas sp. CC4]CAA6685793.1 Choline-sulfatase (EC [Lentimonas sp. CC6]CAA7076267.1 Choline-sulfatase (EC [Lentimonas sp. CC4]CAA7171933.1 Choline-sulfatase (EC [Lentimonas sp. CC21]CAA7181521.1 Choline-sulfatase (EC [Lentimonas sp. CC8]